VSVVNEDGLELRAGYDQVAFGFKDDLVLLL
jgi:hypothetical protein